MKTLRQLRHFSPLTRLGLVMAALVIPALTGSCTPGSEITVAEADVVITRFDPEAPFGSLSSYVMPNYIVHLTGDSTQPDDPNLSRENDGLVLALMEENFNTLGWTRLDSTEIDVADVVVLLAATSTDYWYAWSYWGWCYYWCWYPGWPGWGGPWYPPSGGVSYAYSTGTLLVTMSDDSEVDSLAAVYWEGALNGVLNDTPSSVQQRLQRDIDQMFIQSPYLEVQ